MMKKLKIFLNEQQYNRIILTEKRLLIENRVDFLRNQYVNKPVKSIDKQQVIDNATFDKIVAADPSANKQYSQWLLNLYFWKQLMLEDLYKATEYLMVFDKNKNKMPERDINKKDINGYYYDSLQKLFLVVQPFMEIDNEENLGNSALIKKIKNEESEKFYEDDEWLIVIPKTERASCLYGKGTQWCTAADKGNNVFKQYNDQGKIYINIHKPTNKKYQFHFETSGFMDENDKKTKILFFNDTLLKVYYKDLVKITELNFENEQLSKLPKSLNLLTSLTIFTCGMNLLENINISDNINIEILSCINNQIKSLNISNNRNLKSLYCGNNQLQFLDVSKNKELEYLQCHDNLLQFLDVSKNENIKQIYCTNNPQLKEIKIAKNIELKKENIFVDSHTKITLV